MTDDEEATTAASETLPPDGRLRTDAVVNAVLAVLIAAAFWYLFTNAWKQAFTCDGLLVQRYDEVPSGVCEGVGAGGVGEFFGISGDVVPGLGDLIDTPLNVVRQVSLAVVLLVLVVVSFLITFILGNLRKVARLLALDREQWAAALRGLRGFLVVLAVMTGAFFLVAGV
ncbi:MAG: hypothetical protein AAGD35_11195 [Actinomycetota bacterium]